MTKFEALRNFCKRGVLVMAIMLSVNYLFDLITAFGSFSMLEYYFRYEDYTSALSVISGAMSTFILSGLIVLDMWLIFGGVKGGGSFTKVMMKINSILMYILLGIIATLSVICFVALIGAEVPEAIFAMMPLFGVLVMIILFFLFMYNAIGRVAADMNRRLHTGNEQGIFTDAREVKLGKYLITLIVFAGLGLIMQFAMSAVMPNYYGSIYSLIDNLAWELDLNYSARRELYSLVNTVFQINGFSIVRSLLMIGIYSYGIALVSKYKKLVSA